MSIREPFWTIHPVTGDRVRVLPAVMIEDAQARQNDAEVKVDVMREGAARLRMVLRRARHTETQDELSAIDEDLRDGLTWLAQGAPARDVEHVEQ